MKTPNIIVSADFAAHVWGEFDSTSNYNDNIELYELFWFQYTKPTHAHQIALHSMDFDLVIVCVSFYSIFHFFFLVHTCSLDREYI